MRVPSNNLMDLWNEIYYKVGSPELTTRANYNFKESQSIQSTLEFNFAMQILVVLRFTNCVIHKQVHINSVTNRRQESKKQFLVRIFVDLDLCRTFLDLSIIAVSFRKFDFLSAEFIYSIL
jgi:hypothetical protein